MPGAIEAPSKKRDSNSGGTLSPRAGQAARKAAS